MTDEQHTFEACPPLLDDPGWKCAHPKCGTPDACSREQAATLDALREALSELCDLVDDPDYRPDAFTTQPARILLCECDQGSNCGQHRGERL